jgi:hypothetical protein
LPLELAFVNSCVNEEQIDRDENGGLQSGQLYFFVSTEKLLVGNLFIMATVKSVYNDHPGVTKTVAVVDRWSLLRVFYVIKAPNGTTKWWSL